MTKVDYTLDTRKLSLSYFLTLAVIIALTYLASYFNTQITREFLRNDMVIVLADRQKMAAEHFITDLLTIPGGAALRREGGNRNILDELASWDKAQKKLRDNEEFPVKDKNILKIIRETDTHFYGMRDSLYRILTDRPKPAVNVNVQSVEFSQTLNNSRLYIDAMDRLIQALLEKSLATSKAHYRDELILNVIQIGLLLFLGGLIFLPVLRKWRKTHTELAESQQKYSDLVEKSRDGIVILQEGVVKFVNPGMANLLGMKEEELLGTDFLRLVSPASREQVKNRYTKRLNGVDVPNIYEVDLIKKDATILSCEINANLIIYQQSPADLVFLRDISRRRLDAEKIRESRANLARAQEIAHLGNWVWNFQTGKITWSEEILRILGLPPRAFPENFDKFMEYVYPDDRQVVKAAVDRAVASGDSYEVDHRILAGGQIRFVKQIGETEFDGENKPLRLIGVLMDTTNLTEKMNQLKLYELMIENTADPVYLVDYSNDYRMTYVNQAAVDHYGYPREEILKWQIKDWDPNFNEENLPELKKQMLANPGMILETEHKTGRGETIPVQVTLNSAEIDGRFYNFGYIKNIKKQKETEQNLIFAKEEAERASKAKSEFLANMSHEIRTPLNAILGFTDILKERIHDATNRSFLASISSSGKTLLRLINDILDLSKVEAGRLELEYSDVNVPYVFQDMKQVFSQALESKALAFIVEISEDFPKSLLLDEIRLRQILINLIGNSIKFTDKGSIRMAARYMQDNAGDAERDTITLQIEVSDTGIGIDTEKFGNIFEPFSQAAGHSARYGGTGLGLAITRRLVDMMKGEITLDSKVNEGCRFTMTFKNVAIGSGEQQDLLAGIDEPPVEFFPATILIADDIGHNREVVKGFMSQSPFTFYEAVNGLVALEMAKTCMPDLIIMDLKMPVMDGYDAIKKIKEDPDLKDIPILIATASGMETRKKELEPLVSGVLNKPFGKLDMLRMFRKILKYKYVSVESGAPVKPSPEAVVLSDDQRRKLKNRLETEMMEKWSEVSSALEFDEIYRFAKSMGSIAAEFDYSPLVDWSQKLQEAAQTFNIDAIKKSMNQFAELIGDVF